jgi:hypothetical protein
LTARRRRVGGFLLSCARGRAGRQTSAPVRGGR